MQWCNQKRAPYRLSSYLGVIQEATGVPGDKEHVELHIEVKTTKGFPEQKYCNMGKNRNLGCLHAIPPRR